LTFDAFFCTAVATYYAARELIATRIGCFRKLLNAVGETEVFPAKIKGGCFAGKSA